MIKKYLLFIHCQKCFRSAVCSSWYYDHNMASFAIKMYLLFINLRIWLVLYRWNICVPKQMNISKRLCIRTPVTSVKSEVTLNWSAIVIPGTPAFINE